MDIDKEIEQLGEGFRRFGTTESDGVVRASPPVPYSRTDPSPRSTRRRLARCLRMRVRCRDLRRVGLSDTLFPIECNRMGEVLEQQLEALVGTLRAAKKRGIVSYQGQMLMMPVHKEVVCVWGGAGRYLVVLCWLTRVSLSA